MKVLTATVVSWLLCRAGDCLYWVTAKLFDGACKVEDWAGIGGPIKAGGTD